MKYLPILILLLAAPVQAADNVKYLSTQECLQLIRDYWTEFETSRAEPAHLFDKFGTECESTKELDNLMINDQYINDIIARLEKKGLLK